MPPPGRRPADDPGFAALHGRVTADARGLRTHPPAVTEAARAGAAAVPPANDVSSRAQAAQVDVMSGAQPGAFDKAAFLVAVRAAIARAAPANAAEAEDFGSSGEAALVKGAVKGQVADGTQATGRDIRARADQPPDATAVTPKPVTPLAPPRAPGIPGDPGTAAAMPGAAPAEQLDLSRPRAEVDTSMAAAGVTDQTLAGANEPAFSAALDAKRAGEAHTATAPARVRADEVTVLQDTRAAAAVDASGALAAMAGARTGADSAVAGRQGAARSADEGVRARVASQLEGIYEATRTDTGTILTGLDAKVDAAFDAGEQQARDAFDAYHSTKVRNWKLTRYLLSPLGPVQWIADKFKPLHPELARIFADARAMYVTRMDRVITGVADLIGAELGRARARIAQGRAQIQRYVGEQQGEAGRIAREAERSIGSRFDELDRSVDTRGEGLVDSLAERYVAARTGVDERIRGMQDEHKGLWDRVKDAVGGVLETVAQLKDLLGGILARAAGVVTHIIRDPIGFLGQLVTGIRAGLTAFVGNIEGHLKRGLQSWLFGQLADAGIELPETFDVKGVFTTVASLVGLSWANFRSRLVARVGEPAAARIEQGLDFVKAIASGGIGAAWSMIADKLTGLKDMVMEQLRSFIVERVIVSGIQWLIGLVNPAAAFVKACRAIYDLVRWFIENGSRLKDLVEAVLGSVEAVVSGGVGKVASMIEGALGRALPLAIGFLANLLGLGGLSEKVTAVLQSVQAPVNKAFDFLVGKAAGWGRALMGRLRTSGLGRAFERGRASVRDRVAGAREALGLDPLHESVVLRNGERHELSLSAKPGFEMTMASDNPGPLVQVAGALASPGGASSVAALYTEARAAVAAAPEATRRAVARRWFRRLTAAVRAMAVNRAAPEAGALTPPTLGQVARHGANSQGTRHPDPRLSMESEHVIPVRLISEYFSRLFGGPPIERGSAEDARMHTVRIYFGAARIKTASDERLRRRLPVMLEHGTVNNLNQQAGAARQEAHDTAPLKGRQRRVTPEERVEVRRRALKGFVDKFWSLVGGRARVTMDAIRQDHQADGAARGESAPLPTESDVRRAFDLQSEDIRLIIAQRGAHTVTPAPGD